VAYFFTYILLCQNSKNKKQKFYVGSTSDLKKRIVSHLSKTTKTTRNYDKITLVYYEACLSKADARRRELQLKTGFGRGYIKRRIKSYLKNLRV